MKDRSTIQLPKSFISELRELKKYRRETYEDVMKRTLKENEDLKNQIKETIRGKRKK
jgi:hypothetical protein